MSNLLRMLHACVILFSTNAKRPFLLKYGKLQDLLALIQNITMLEGFLGDFISAIIARMFCGNHLNL